MPSGLACVSGDLENHCCGLPSQHVARLGSALHHEDDLQDAGSRDLEGRTGRSGMPPSSVVGPLACLPGIFASITGVFDYLAVNAPVPALELVREIGELGCLVERVDEASNIINESHLFGVERQVAWLQGHEYLAPAAFPESYGPAVDEDATHLILSVHLREGYEVDPVRDLVPLCPNCHRAVHSKPGGEVYTVEELRWRRECARH